MILRFVSYLLPVAALVVDRPVHFAVAVACCRDVDQDVVVPSLSAVHSVLQKQIENRIRKDQTNTKNGRVKSSLNQELTRNRRLSRLLLLLCTRHWRLLLGWTNGRRRTNSRWGLISIRIVWR